MGNPNVCQPKATACSGTAVTCNEAADCTGGKACCLSSTSITAGTLSCQELVNGKCPAAPIASAQICRSSGECPPTVADGGATVPGSCSLWSCLGGTLTIESCAEPTPGDPSLCVKM